MKIVLTNGGWWRIFQLCAFPAGMYTYLKLTRSIIRQEYIWWIFIGAIFLIWILLCVRIRRTNGNVK